ncbi:unnamed protein product [Angiostrongylus costaricensis]|uniref:Ras-related protein Rab n=1 Tax=Angiostrongylus costaricensis TaxID=334426 RepID=A0A0R3PZS6_ANGCS|nr:unnamed protein product [Angiostrongylus costaricensis]
MKCLEDWWSRLVSEGPEIPRRIQISVCVRSPPNHAPPPTNISAMQTCVEHGVFNEPSRNALLICAILVRTQKTSRLSIRIALTIHSGQDRYGVMTRVYYKDAHAAVIVMDSTREQTIEGACRWKADLDQKVTLVDGSHVPAILVVNKCDIDNQINEKDLNDLKVKNGFVSVVRASAKANFGIQETFTAIVRKVRFLSHIQRPQLLVQRIIISSH